VRGDRGENYEKCQKYIKKKKSNTDNKKREIFVKFVYHPPLRNQTTILCHAQYRWQPAQWAGEGPDWNPRLL
jgi:hypothetical protein